MEQHQLVTQNKVSNIFIIGIGHNLMYFPKQKEGSVALEVENVLGSIPYLCEAHK